MPLFRNSSGYRYLDAYVLANVVELATTHFCDRFLTLRNDPGGRTYAQMTHAARSGVRNFAEGAERLMTSFSTAITLLDAARASLLELRGDYNKWLMAKWEIPWDVDSEPAQRLFGIRLDKPDYGHDVNREFCRHVLTQFRKFEPEILAEDALVRANALLILIARTANMLDKVIRNLGDEFTEEGGFRERMTDARTAARAANGAPAQAGPPCPKCGGDTSLRHARKDNRPFWGCTNYPACNGTIDCAKPPPARPRIDSNRQPSTAPENSRNTPPAPNPETAP